MRIRLPRAALWALVTLALVPVASFLGSLAGMIAGAL